MGLSIPQLLILLLIVVLIFGAKRLRTLGADLGGALKNFRAAVKESDEEGEAGEDIAEAKKLERSEDGTGVIEGKIASRDREKA
jgi:sec-independent protein translocase protein TatA